MTRGALMLLCWALVGCSSATRVVRLETGQGEPLVHRPRASVEPVEVDDDEFKETVAKHSSPVPAARSPLESARQLLGVPEHSGWYRYERQSRRILPLDANTGLKLELSPADEELNRQYMQWCARAWGAPARDCLHLLVDSPLLDGDGRYALAMAIAQGAVLGSMKDTLGQMVNPEAVAATVTGAMTVYLMLWMLPEPISKGVAALMTVGLVGYLGWDLVWKLIDGWRVMVTRVDGATTFDEIQEAGERFGGVMGQKGTQALVMLATLAVGNTAAGMAAKMPLLPGAGQAAVVAEAQLGIRYSAPALAGVVSVAIDAQGVVVALAPGAVAMAAQSEGAAAGALKAGFRAFKSMRDFKSALGSAGAGKNWHHVVEQTPSNVERFGPEALHNTENVIELDADVHRKVSGFYSSKQELTDNMVVREWLRGKSYEEQRAFGLMILRQFGAIP